LLFIVTNVRKGKWCSSNSQNMEVEAQNCAYLRLLLQSVKLKK